MALINPLKTYFSALPPYFGGKRRLAPWIFNHLQQAVPRSEWESLTFADAFVGGGSMCMMAKVLGFREILANDWSTRSQLVIQGLLENQGIHLQHEDLLLCTQEVEGLGWVETDLCPSVFSTRHAKALDAMLMNIEALRCHTRQAMARLLVWHLVGDYVCFGTSIGVSNRPYAEVLDGHRDWQALNPKRFADGSMEKLCQPTWANLEKYAKRINKGIFCGGPVIGSQRDVFDWLPSITGDILYLDPPYAGTLGYEGANRVLDRLLTGEQPAMSSSPFSKGTKALWQLLDASLHFPVWVVSYGNVLLDLDELAAGIQRVAPTRQLIAVDKPYKHLSHITNNAENRELLVIAY